MVSLELPVGKFSRALNSVNALVDTAPVLFSEDGFYIETVDEANVAAVTMCLQPDAFDYYNADGLEVHLDIEQLTQILQKFDADQQVTIEYKKEDGRFEVSIESFTFDLSLIHPESVRGGQKAGEIEPPAEIVIDSSEIRKAVRLADMFSDELIMGVDEKRGVFYINAIGDSDSMAVSFSEGDKEVTKVTPSKAHSIYSRSYLSQITKNIPATEHLSIKLGQEYPAKITFEIADMNGHVTYGLAPRFR
ncbi:hypothetical protein [Haloprofundus salilacus]|uniref:hypothetical protein n=1 Tax=Haloprofundus salilacus TaxID=2876190 RepID=UPI001CCEDDFB|nr:hypothetical protein [Haloprofundus salilacus]